MRERKQTQDIAEVADVLKYERILIRMNTTKRTKLAKVQRQIGYRKDWAECLKKSRRKFGYSATASVSLSAVDQRETLTELKKKTCKIYQSDS